MSLCVHLGIQWLGLIYAANELRCAPWVLGSGLVILHLEVDRQ